ncbi:MULTISPECIES: winged helix DNA-binding protein [unclassified Achromobacter]|uniref:winged helix DNA-binding protein n=1 Tax=unclassified Achromobacter TaxID=2626865 RepID=UPI00069D218C|nr:MULTISPECIES: winged helix DNA-binding protein [unclassified Achromobacter]KOF54737.1 transcriptional regulator [Achromobacter sp. DMS1]
MAKPLIASSAHLAGGSAPDLSEVEFGLMIASHAFNRWTVRCMAAAGLPDLTPTDVMVVHHVYHRQRPKKLADICFTLNVEDTHIVSYSLKKLERLGMVRGQRSGKEVFYSVTPEGAQIIQRYAEIREQCLTSGLEAPGSGGLEFSRQLAHALRALSGLYDQAARAATSL